MVKRRQRSSRLPKDSDDHRQAPEEAAAKIKEIFAINLRTIRLSTGKSQETLARENRFDRTFVSTMERGLVQPSLETLCRVAHGVGVTVARLIEGVDEVFPKGKSGR